MNLLLTLATLLWSHSLLAADLRLTGETDASWPRSVMMGTLQARSEGRTVVTVEIDSPGGFVEDGVKAVQFMELGQSIGMIYDCKVTGLAMSAAFLVFSACDVRSAAREARLLWHPIWIQVRVIDLMPMSKELVAELAKCVELQNNLNSFISTKTRVAWSRWKESYLNEKNFSAQEFSEFAPGFMSVLGGPQ